MDKVGKAISKHNEEVLNAVIEKIRKNYGERFLLKEIATEYSYSSIYFNRMFKQCTGQTFNKFVQRVRCENAMRLLLETDMPVGRICNDVGYSDSKQFFAIFKRYAQCSPNAYRKMHK